MIWASEYLSPKDKVVLSRLNPLMSFRFSASDQSYYWKTFCAGYKIIYENDQALEVLETTNSWLHVPINLIDCYPNEPECVDNILGYTDSFEYVMDELKRGIFHHAFHRAIEVTPRFGRYLTIEKTRLRIFREALKLGRNEFSTIPVVISKTLSKEIRRVRLYGVEDVLRGFICDDWEEARQLSMCLEGVAVFKERIEYSYKWIPDYLAPRKSNPWLDNLAVPVSEYLKYFAHERMSQA